MNSKFSTLWQIMSGNRSRYAFAILAMALGTGVSYAIPLICSVILDSALGTDPLNLPGPLARQLDAWGGIAWLRANLWAPAAAIVALAAVSAICIFFKNYLSTQAAERIALNMRRSLYDRLQRLPSSFFDRHQTGDLIQRCTSDVETVRLFLSAQVIEMGHATMMMLGVLPIMLMLSPRMTLVSLAAVPFIVGFSIVFFIRVRHTFAAADVADGKLSATLQENLTGIRVVRAFARQDHEKKKFDEKNADYRDKNFNLLRLLAWFWSSSDLICLTQTCAVMAAGSYWASRGEISVGTLYAFIAYVAMFLWPIRQMGRVLIESSKTLVALERIGEILKCPTESEEDIARLGSAPKQSLPATVRGEIVFENVSFTYPTALRQHEVEANAAAEAKEKSENNGKIAKKEPAAPPPEILHGLSFRAAPGQTLALIGPSGSGKSSLIRLLLRLYDASSGTITLDGVDISQLGRTELRRAFAVVMQEPFLFTKNIRDNIRIARSSADENEVSAAAADASIHSAIESFEKRYDTMLGERGVTLSGGQRQRVAIARALLLDAPVLVLDDALSAVDTETEAAILDALRKRRGKRTTILIAHRLSTLLHADQILVVEHGRIIQRGTHETLVKEDGLYRKLWRIQAALEEDLEKELSQNKPAQELATGEIK